METIFDPPITHFVIFSGGGGMLSREAEVNFKPGENQLKVKGVPASFDPETFLVRTSNTEILLKEIILRKPSRQYVEDNLRREGAAARKLIDSSVDIGAKRGQLIEICEEIAQRTYLDEEVDLSLWMVSPTAQSSLVVLSYFIDDVRFRWKPTITAELGDEQGEVRVQGLIAITNESAHRFVDVEVSFADFARDLSPDAQNFRAKPEEMKQAMANRMMKKMMLK